MEELHFNIAAVERETGLSKDVLRIWEKRYGFPSPVRDAHGERSYPAAQVERLRLLKRLMDQGHRPGKLMATPAEELGGLASRRRPAAAAPVGTPEDDLEGLVALLAGHDGSAYLHAMQQRLARQGLQAFVQDTVGPLAVRVGTAWESGRLQVYDEHLFTELTKRLLRQAISALPVPERHPRLLLTTAPDEHHVLGLLMVEALFTLEGAACVPLGTQMPLAEIALAADAHRVDVVALSFSAAFAHRQVPALLAKLRALLPRTVALWAGGAGIARVPPLEGVLLLPRLEDAVSAVAAWRSAAPPRPPAGAAVAGG